MRFDSYHPAINFVYFAAVTAMTLLFNHPVFLCISYVCAFAYSVKLNGWKGLLFDLFLIPCICAFAFYYASYHHFGITNLASTFIGNRITLESIVWGFVLGISWGSVLMWFSCVHAVVTSDKVVYLFGKVSPRLSLFLSILLRMVPHIRERAGKINTAQQALGRGTGQGGIFARMRNSLRLVSILITWTMEHLVETSTSMKCRGYLLRGRTAYSIYRFDYRDRSFVIALFCCLTVIMTGVLFDQTTILYNPEIIFNRMTPLSCVFYAAYAAFCLMPMALQTAGERRFAAQRMRNVSSAQEAGHAK